jgi:hypothetical protein
MSIMVPLDLSEVAAEAVAPAVPSPPADGAVSSVMVGEGQVGTVHG